MGYTPWNPSPSLHAATTIRDAELAACRSGYTPFMCTKVSDRSLGKALEMTTSALSGLRALKNSLA